MKLFRYLRVNARILILGLTVLLASCTTNSGDSNSGPKASPSLDTLVRKHICGISPPRRDYCPTDFTRLAVDPAAASQKEMWILGYLAVDDGAVVLYENESAYRYMEYGKSIRIEGAREDLSELASSFGYRVVRIGGTFHANSYTDPRDDRLGRLVGPLRVREAQVRLGEREGPTDIALE